MNRARLGTLALAAVLSPALLAGCGFVNGFKEGFNEASNTVEVCNAAIDRYNTMNTALEKAAADLTAATDKAVGMAKFNTAVKTEFGTLHTGLHEQVGKATAADLKKALTELDDQVVLVEAKPDTFAEPATAAKFDALSKNLNTACKAKKN